MYKGRAFGYVLFIVLLTACGDKGEVVIKDAYARATNGQNGAVFMTIENNTGQKHTLVSATSDVSKTVELHTHVQEGDVFKMIQIDRIPVLAHSKTELKPAGLHIMLMGLKAPLKENDQFDLDLTFEDGTKKTVPVLVGSPGQSTCSCSKSKATAE